MPGGAICPQKLVSFFIKIKLISSPCDTDHRPAPTLRLDIIRQETSQGQDQAAGRARRATGRAPRSPACRRRKPYTPAPLPPTPPQQPPPTSFRRNPHSICRNLLRPIFIIYCYSITYNTSTVVGTPLKQGYLRQ